MAHPHRILYSASLPLNQKNYGARHCEKNARFPNTDTVRGPFYISREKGVGYQGIKTQVAGMCLCLRMVIGIVSVTEIPPLAASLRTFGNNNARCR